MAKSVGIFVNVEQLNLRAPAASRTLYDRPGKRKTWLERAGCYSGTLSCHIMDICYIKWFLDYGKLKLSP